MINLVIFFITSSIGGILLKIKYDLMLLLLAFEAFIPSMTFFSGSADYAMRLGILSWFVWAIFLKRSYKVNWFQIYSLWLVISVAGIVGYIINGVGLINGLGTVFTPSGFSLQYVLLCGVILAGKNDISKYINAFIVFAVLFYVIGGIYQRFILGALFYLNPNQADIMTPYYFNDGRMVGLFSQSSHLTGTVLNVAFSFQLSKMIYEKKWNLYNILLLLLLVVGILLAQNRGNYIALIGVLLFYLIKMTFNNRIKVLLIISFIIICIYLYLPSLVGKYQIERRILNESNIIGRANIYKNFINNLGNILVNNFIGFGFSPQKSLGLHYWESIVSMGLAENIISDYIGKYGWIATGVIIIIIIKKYKILIKQLKYYNTDWVGNGINFSWLSLLLCYLVNTDTHFLVPLIFILSSIWSQEKKRIV